jgi:nuclease YhcG-like protein
VNHFVAQDKLLKRAFRSKSSLSDCGDPPPPPTRQIGIAGKMNFYLNVVDDMLRHEHDNPSIGLILCRDKKKILAEYALRGVNKPIGVSEYELTRSLPDALKASLPTIEDIEGELATR